MKLPIVIHYGAKKYNPTKVYNIYNQIYYTKPKGGLWTSPLTSKYGWKDWCKESQFRNCVKNNSFKLKFYSGSKLFIINSLKDLLAAPLIDCEFSKEMGLNKKLLNFELLAKFYDGIWLTAKGQQQTHFYFSTNLYGWDCETILIFNPYSCYQIK